MFIIQSKKAPWRYYRAPQHGITTKRIEAYVYTKDDIAKFFGDGFDDYSDFAVVPYPDFCADAMDGTPERLHAEGPAPQHSVEHPLMGEAVDHGYRFMWVSSAGDYVPSVIDPPVECRLPCDSEARKGLPMATGLLDYFPDALADVARLSKIGNDKHNPGQPLHWSREKSNDHADTILRHMVDRGTVDTDGVLHDTKVAWRALAQLQLAIEKERAGGRSYP